MRHKKTTSDLNQLTGEIVEGFELVAKSVLTPDQQRKIGAEIYSVITEIRNIGDSQLPRPGFLFRAEIKKLLGR